MCICAHTPPPTPPPPLSLRRRNLPPIIIHYNRPRKSNISSYVSTMKCRFLISRVMTVRSRRYMTGHSLGSRLWNRSLQPPPPLHPTHKPLPPPTPHQPTPPDEAAKTDLPYYFHFLCSVENRSSSRPPWTTPRPLGATALT